MSRKRYRRPRHGYGRNTANTTSAATALDSAKTAASTPNPAVAQRPAPEQLIDVAYSLYSRQFEPRPVPSLADIRRMYSLPVTLGAPAEVREQMDMAFDSMGGFQMIHSSFQQHLSELGQTPVASFLGYATLQNLAQDPLIRACVQTVADDLTRKWIDLVGGEEEDNDKIERLDELMNSQYRLQALFHDAAAMVGYYGGAFIFIDTGATDEQLELPLNFSPNSAELNPNRGTLRFKLIDPVNVTPNEYNCTEPLKQNYMRPKYWWVLGKRVHHSRMLPLVENEPPTLLKPAYNFLGIARAQLLADYVAHFKEARIYEIDLLKKISLLVVKTNVEQMFSTPDGIRNFDIKMQALQRYRDNNSVYVCDKNEEDVNNVQTSIAGATDIVRQQLEFVAAINRTPAVKILGISPSGFNATGESDITNYYDHIRSQQELYRKSILRCIHAIELVHFGSIDTSIDFEFNELASDNATAKTMDANTRAQMWGALLQNQVLSPDEVREAVKSDPDMHLEFISGDAPDAEPMDMEGLSDDYDALARMTGLPPSDGDAAPAAPNPTAATNNPLDDVNKYDLGKEELINAANEYSQQQ